MDIKKYIESGILEEFCLGLLGPEQVAELEEYCLKYPAIIEALEERQYLIEQYLKVYQKKAPEGSKESILKQLAAEKLTTVSLDPITHQFNEFVEISDHSDHKAWSKLVSPIQPSSQKNIVTHQLFQSPDRKLLVVWVKDKIEEEFHNELDESFLLLEGSCTCKLGDSYVDLEPGDFLRIPLHTHHELKVTSDTPVKFILSRVKIA